MIEIDLKLFLKDFESFKKYILPLKAEERIQQQLPSLTEEETYNLYLDLYNEYFNDGAGKTDK